MTAVHWVRDTGDVGPVCNEPHTRMRLPLPNPRQHVRKAAGCLEVGELCST